MSARLFQLAAALLGLLSATGTAAELELRVVADKDQRPTAVEATGFADVRLDALRKLSADDPEWNLLLVYVLNEQGMAQTPAVAGQYEVFGESVRFTPRYRFSPGAKYVAELEVARFADGTKKWRSLEFALPKLPPAEPTRVTHIYPSPDVLPENQLRFYIHFSAPMAFGDAYSHVKLMRIDGTEVKRAFLEIGEELWDGTGQRLTLLFDPGRVKQGLKPREEFGPVLEAGKSYRLVIDKSWRDVNGQPLAAGFEKRFDAGPAVETAVDANQWKVEPPAAESRSALRVTFDRPLDRALIQRMINIVDPAKKPVEGEIDVSDNERRWEFRPDKPWQAGSHALVIDTALEDSAGNNLARPFEVDVFDRVDEQRGPELMRIPFEIRSR